MPRPTRNEIYESVIRKMVLQALEQQELEFTRDHAFDSDEQLLDYIRQQASVFHYAPRYKEIIGWKLITERFGSWGAAIEKAGLHLSSSCSVERLPRIQEEARKQKELYRQKKAEKNLLSEQRWIQQEAKRKETVKKKYDSVYIEGIGNLYEFDCGPQSGWMYNVNGTYPGLGCSGYTLADGDTIVFSYTLNLGADLGAEKIYG